MTDDALINSAICKTGQAHAELEAVYRAGHTTAVPAESLAAVRRTLTVALANVNELERRARGGPAPVAGGLPNPEEPRNRV